MLTTNWRSRGNWIALDCIFVFCIFSIYAGSITPEVNESHYWVKAKHFWNPQFAGKDMFVQSKDAHWFFFATIGALSNTFTLPVAAWIGRIIGWLSLSFAWSLFASRFSCLRLAGSLTAGMWIAAMHSGHLSGEWVVGGCEAKVFAYAAALIGLSCALDRSFGWGWVWMGVASAFHVLTGAWLVIATFLVFIVPPNRLLQVRKSGWIGLVAGGGISLLGLVPALSLNSGVNPSLKDQGAIIYVFQRLPHHLVPTRFSSERWISFAILVAVSIAAIVLVRLRLRTKNKFAGKAEDNSRRLERKPTGPHQQFAENSDAERLAERYSRLLLFALVFSSIAAAGLAIDLGLSSWATNWCASLLRYYWFRWNDVIWPTVLCISLLLLLERSLSNSTFGRAGVVAAMTIPACVVVGTVYLKHYEDSVSPADQASLLIRHESDTSRKQIHTDWQDICSYIRSNTPEDAVFLTPRYQQTFKWYSGRAEVVSWKDSPQDALGLIEWESRLLNVFPRDSNGYGVAWSEKLLYQLSDKYQFDYVLVDRRIQKTPPILEFIQSNGTYALFKMIKIEKP